MRPILETAPPLPSSDSAQRLVGVIEALVGILTDDAPRADEVDLNRLADRCLAQEREVAGLQDALREEVARRTVAEAQLECFRLRNEVMREEAAAAVRALRALQMATPPPRVGRKREKRPSNFLP